VKTQQDITDDWQHRQEELAAREARWSVRRRRFIKRMLVTSAIIFCITFRLQAFGGSFSWWLWPPTLIVGALAAWPIVYWNLGPLTSMPVYGGIAVAWEVCAFLSGGMSGAGNIGGVMLTVNILAFWPMFGCILGYLADQEHDDTMQI